MNAVSPYQPVPAASRRRPLHLDRGALVVFVVVYGVLGILTPLYLLSPLPSDLGLGLGQMVCEGLTQYAALRLAQLAARGQPRFTAITFFIFIYVWTGLAPSAQLTVESFPWPILHRPDQADRAALMIALAVAAYEMGRIAAALKPWRPPVWQLDFKISKSAVVGLCVLAPLLFLAAVVSLHGIGPLFGTRARYDLAIRHLSRMRGLITGAALRAPAFVALMLSAHYSLTHWHGLRREGKRAMLICTTLMAVLNIAANFPTTLIRAWLSAVVLTPVFALIRWRPLLAPAWVLGLSLSAVILFPYLDAFRRAPTIEAGIDALSLDTNVIDPIIHKGDYDVFQQTANSVVYVDLYGIDWGHNLLSAVFFFVPRAIWPSKSPGTSFEINGRLGVYHELNLSVPLWMEAYIGFGWVGVALGLGLYGFASARGEAAYLRLLAEGGAPRVAAVLLPFWGAYQFFILRGDLQNVLAFSSLPLLLVLLSTRARLKRRVRLPPARA